MRVDLFHNKIVKDTMSESFKRSVAEKLVPLIAEACPDATRILMYEDYIQDSFLEGGKWYYPLTVYEDGLVTTVWVMWDFDKKSFSSPSPYSYLKDEPLEFELCGFVPESFIDRMKNRAISYDDTAIKVNVRAASDDPLILSGRYSQTFVDALAVQITRAISRAMSIEGIEKSSIELELMFAPGTYMEHTSENITYRRLLLVDGTSQPRDFWVKWTRKGGGVAYTVNDMVTDGDITFELGEDVSQKIREKEYRFLCSSNPSKYQSAMGKRTVTEWREVVKRAIKRGEVKKVPLVSEPDDTETMESLYKIIGDAEPTVADVTAPAPTPETITEDSFSDIMEMARRALINSESYSEGEPAPEPIFDLGIVGEDSIDTLEPLPEDDNTDFLPSFDMNESMTVDAALALLENEGEESASEELADISEELADIPEELTSEIETVIEDESADEPELEIPTEDVPDDELDTEDITESEPAPEDEGESCDEIEESLCEAPDETHAMSEDELRRTIEAEVRLEYEKELREKTSEELQHTKKLYEMLRVENFELSEKFELLSEGISALREENDMLREELRSLREENTSLSLARIAAEEAQERSEKNENTLRQELEARDRADARERDRIAEVARIAVEEQKRREREEEELRIKEETERAEEEERNRIAEERRAEEERIRRDIEERANRTAIENYTPSYIEPKPKAPIAPTSPYISKRAKIIFRYPVDMGIVNSIKTIVELTLSANDKQHIHIKMKANQEDKTTINLDILQMPAEESELLIAIVKAIGNGRIGVSKIILE